MSGVERVLLCGTGPVSIQLAVSLKIHLGCHVGMAGRESVRSASFFASLEQSKQHIQVTIQNEKHRPLAGGCTVDQVFKGYNTLEGEWDTLILAVTTDAYIDVLQEINDEFVKQLKFVILVSPTFGSSLLVSQYLLERNVSPEIISFSTYLGDTRWLYEQPSNEVITTGVKRKVYIGSTVPSSTYVRQLSELFERLHISLAVMSSPLEAETRNISLYVHPPLFMNDFSLEVIFGEQRVQKYVYKLYPEGPITPALICSMRSQWQEIEQITDRLHIQGVNLLQFMTDDNYPVRLESLSRQDIEQFDRLEAIHQEFLLYIRYASLLIDPFSEPDANGTYFDFSAVPFRRIFINREGELDVPRMPKEDYYRIKMIQGIARHVNVACPTIDHFIATYEAKLQEVTRTHPDQRLSTAFVIQSFGQDVRMICNGLTGGKV
ncbi:opine metallophore biosynthesis dehydrogenase [Paenibacillus polysaccharolyticus]|uniref:opine metallophore biosynthesis dehydrogenase n=1 Tax=Paenibacillus polysaccharolyticus TaxID=582692 RepID=UPI00203B3382|nr:opine metallophore biosynthesis dehydrogenase [Paenibacillus polysaccharolyticus]MCM3134647.1 opine metallophore biosynthesis dehydrogenase [Paenibacillus polysaccharolyticus]